MNPFDKIQDWLKAREITMSNKEKAIIKAHTVSRQVKPRTTLMDQDQQVEKFYFLNSGIARLYRKYEGRDYTVGLIDSRDFLAAPQLVLAGEISTCGLETLTDVSLLEWDKESLLAIKQKVPGVYNIELALMARLLNWVQQNQIELVCYTAEERYQMLLERQPDVLLNIPLKYIASFLGIHTDSLSRIRKRK